MRILESILNILFAIIDFWQKTSDPFLNQYRSYVRQIIAFSAMTAILLLLAGFIAPFSEDLQSLTMIGHYLVQLVFIFAMIFLLIAIWSCIALCMFLRESGDWE
ncbi:hypothetical protein [Methylotenera sp.]|uniref:hypothetical protein n=1 Tax=Methylotenera sp. TaxID=2051956 RepID=UPI002EDB4B9D